MTLLDPEDFAAAMEAHMLHCRELGHSWGAYTASYDPKARVYDRTLRCESCGCTRHQVIDASGDITTNGSYKYPPGYLAKGIMVHVGHKVPRATFRRASLERATGSNVRTLRKRTTRKKAS